MPLLTWRQVEAHRLKAEPYEATLDRGLQLCIAPDDKRNAPRTPYGQGLEH